MISEDPLYSFTERSAEFYLSILFEIAWRPLLVYIEEMYTPPISLSGFLGKSLDSFTSQQSKSTLFDSECRPFDFNTRPESKAFQKIPENHRLTGAITKLTIRIPRSQDHPFWKRPPRDLSEWDFDKDELSFHVERWGFSNKESFYNAMQRARDIIACIRMHISGRIEVVRLLQTRPISPLIIPQCPVLSLGHEVTALWGPYSSITPWTEKTTNTFLAQLQKKIDSVSYIQSRLLLQYYQVLSTSLLY
jgi:hypothetical protein